MERGEFRPSQEAFQQFDAGLPGAGNDLSGNAVMPPIAANLVRLMERAQEERQSRGFTEFYPQWWMYTKSLEVAVEMGNRNEEVGHAIADVQTAYGIAAYQEFTPRQKNRFREVLREDIHRLNNGSVTLNQWQRELLTQIAIATNIPINPEKEEYHSSTILTQLEITEEEMELDPRYNTW